MDLQCLEVQGMGETTSGSPQLSELRKQFMKWYGTLLSQSLNLGNNELNAGSPVTFLYLAASGMTHTL